MALVGVALDRKAALESSRNLYIVIAVDTQDILYNITGTLNIHTVGRNNQVKTFSGLVLNLHLEAGDNALDGLGRNMLANQRIYIVIFQRNVEVG